MNADDEIRFTLAQLADVDDAEDVDGVVALFTDSAKFAPATGVQSTGQAALRTYLADQYAARRASDTRTKHTYASSVIDVDGERAAVATDFVQTTRVGDGEWTVALIGRCHDRLVRRDGHWLFEERRVVDARRRASSS